VALFERLVAIRETHLLGFLAVFRGTAASFALRSLISACNLAALKFFLALVDDSGSEDHQQAAGKGEEYNTDFSFHAFTFSALDRNRQ
jgi:hypothetical protein